MSFVPAVEAHEAGGAVGMDAHVEAGFFAVVFSLVAAFRAERLVTARRVAAELDSQTIQPVAHAHSMALPTRS